jgi:hypothetical protein
MTPKATTRQRKENATMAADHDDGQSVAAWTAVGVLLVGAAVICFGIGFGIVWLDIVGVVVCALGLVAGKVLAMAGFGVVAAEHKPSAASGSKSLRSDASQARQQTQE